MSARARAPRHPKPTKPQPMTDADVRRAQDDGLYVEIIDATREDVGKRGRIAGLGFACDRSKRKHGCHVLLNLLDDEGHVHFVEAADCTLAATIPASIVQASLF